MSELDDLRRAATVYLKWEIQGTCFRLELLLMPRLETRSQETHIALFGMNYPCRPQQRIEIVVQFLIARSRQQGDDRFGPRSLSRHELRIQSLLTQFVEIRMADVAGRNVMLVEEWL